jgi:hypothetical protein
VMTFYQLHWIKRLWIMNWAGSCHGPFYGTTWTCVESLRKTKLSGLLVTDLRFKCGQSDNHCMILGIANSNM